MDCISLNAFKMQNFANKVEDMDNETWCIMRYDRNKKGLDILVLAADIKEDAMLIMLLS